MIRIRIRKENFPKITENLTRIRYIVPPATLSVSNWCGSTSLLITLTNVKSETLLIPKRGSWLILLKTPKERTLCLIFQIYLISIGFHGTRALYPVGFHSGSTILYKCFLTIFWLMGCENCPKFQLSFSVCVNLAPLLAFCQWKPGCLFVEGVCRLPWLLDGPLPPPHD